jgi:hypothetical protein
MPNLSTYFLKNSNVTLTIKMCQKTNVTYKSRQKNSNFRLKYERNLYVTLLILDNKLNLKHKLSTNMIEKHFINENWHI